MVDPKKFLTMPHVKKRALTDNMSVQEHRAFVTVVRKERLLRALERVDKKIAAEQAHGSSPGQAQRRKDQRAQYIKSLDNIAKYGMETPDGGRPMGVRVVT